MDYRVVQECTQCSFSTLTIIAPADTDDWSYCPKCGSPLTETDRLPLPDTTPGKRLDDEFDLSPNDDVLSNVRS